MKKERIKQGLLYLGIGVFVLMVGFRLFISVESIPGHLALKNYLMKELVKAEPLPSGSSHAQPRESAFVYVLGGSQGSLGSRFRIAAELYRKGEARKIFIHSDPTKVGYSPLKGRNLTFDEWAIERLVILGVPEKDVEPLHVDAGFFGTFSEAKGIPEIASKRGYKELVLVTSSYNTRRVWVSFSESIQRDHLQLYVYMSEDRARLRDLLFEYLKLTIYKTFLL